MTTTTTHCVTTGGRAFRLRSSLTAAIAAAALTALGSAPAAGAVAYDESVSGDLSDDGLNPTPLTFTIGDNSVSGTTGRDAAGVPDRDYFTFTIGADERLTALELLPGTETLGFSFIGLEAGNQITLPTNAMTAAGLLGWTHYDMGDVGSDILDDMSIAANGSSGFTRPLGPGSYAIWLQEISPGGAVPYGFNFVVAEVPEPSAWAMFLAGFGLLGLAFRGKRARERKAATA